MRDIKELNIFRNDVAKDGTGVRDYIMCGYCGHKKQLNICQIISQILNVNLGSV